MLGTDLRPPWTSRRLSRALGAARTTGLSEIITSAVVLANAALGMIAQVVLASRFGASRTLDGFFAASAAPFGIIGLAVTAFGAVMIPALGAAKDETERRRRTSELISAAVVIACVVAAAGLLAASVAAWTRAANSELRGAAIEAAPALWLACGFGIVSQAATALHHWRRRFVVAALVSALFPLSLILSAIAFGDRYGTMPLAVGYALAGLSQCVILGLLEPEFPRRFVKPSPESIRIMQGSVVVSLAVLPTVLFPVSDAFWMAALNRPGLTYLNFAGRITVAIAAIITTGTAVVSFPRFVALATEHRYDALEAELFSSLKRCIAILTVAAVSFFLVRNPLISLLFEHGRFTATDRAALVRVLPFYLVGMILMGCSNLVVRAYYAIGARIQLAVLGVASVCFYTLCSGLLAHRLGYLGIGIAHTANWLLFVASQLVILHRRLQALGDVGV